MLFLETEMGSQGMEKIGFKIRIWKSLTRLGWTFLNERNAFN